MMAIFEYNSLTTSGRAMKGTVEAASREQAQEMLDEMGLTVSEISLQKEKSKHKAGVGHDDFLLFNQQLASITKSGIPLERGLSELAEDVASKKMQKLIRELAEELKAGTSLEDAIDKRKKQFPPLYSHILKAGIKSGRLSDVLTSLNKHLEMTNITRRIFIEAMVYPAVVLTMGMVVIGFLYIFIIPTFAEVISDMSNGQASLPALTQLALKLSQNIVPIGITFLAIMATIFGIWYTLSLTPIGRRQKESIIMSVPILGRLYQNSMLSRFADTMAMLIETGADLGESIELASSASSSETLKLNGKLIRDQLDKGVNIMEAHVGRMIPRLFLYSIQLGGQRNELQENLKSLSQMYMHQGQSRQAKLQTILLPAMVILIGLFLGTSIMAMFLPMVRIFTVLM
jgi:type IV pilus assembly protein PilC